VQLSTALIGILSQQLLHRLPKGRVAAYELLVITPAISNLIREGKTFRINSSIQTGKKYGMQLLDDHLFDLWRSELCDEAECLEKANLPDELRNKMEMAKKGLYDDDEDEEDDDDE